MISRQRATFILSSVAALSLGLASCQHEQHEDSNPPVETVIVVRDAPEPPPTDVCDMDKAVTFFAPGSAQLSPKGAHLISIVAECMRDGSMQDERVEIVGHTDPYGPSDQNEILGYHRAAAVARHLRSRGIDWERFEVRSEGERFASNQPRLWPADNRVVVRIDTDGPIAETVEDLEAAVR